MGRTASEGLVLLNEQNGEVSIIEINSETDFVAKNKDFINFCKETSEINFKNKGNINNLLKSKMKNNISVEENIISLISEIGEKITIRRASFFDNSGGKNFYYVHTALEKNIGKIISIVKVEGISNEKNISLGNKLAMHITASNPLAIESASIDKKILDKENEIIKAELINSGKKEEMVDKISKGKLNKFISDNTLLSQPWIMDPKKKVIDILKENKTDKEIKIRQFLRYKVGEGV